MPKNLILDGIPKDWELTKLGEIVNFVKGKKSKKIFKEATYQNPGVIIFIVAMSFSIFLNDKYLSFGRIP